MAITYETIASTTLTSTTSSITLSSIPSNYTDLVLKFYFPSSTASGDNWTLRFNGDSGNNYSTVRDLSNYPYATGDYGVNLSAMYGVLGSTSYATVGTWDIFNYSSSKYKTVLHKGSTYSQRTDMVCATWSSTAAINSITIYCYGLTASAPAGTKISLHGILRG